MKTLKLNPSAICLTLLTFFYITASSSSFAQESPKAAPPPQKAIKQEPPAQENPNATPPPQKPIKQEPSAQDQSPEKMKKDYDQRMQKFDEMNQHLQRRAQSAKDPQMKADVEMMQSKMDKVKAHMQNLERDKGSMSQQQLSEARTNLHTEMEDLKKNYQEMKTKYGGSEGKKKIKGNEVPAEQSSPKQ